MEQGQQERLIIAQAKYDAGKVIFICPIKESNKIQTLDKIKGAMSSTDAIELTIRLVQTIDHLHQLGFQHHALSSNLGKGMFWQIFVYPPRRYGQYFCEKRNERSS